MKMRDLKQETGLGDGVFVSFDEYGIKLRRPPLLDSGGNDHFIYLNMHRNLPLFLAYVDDLKVKLSQHLKDEAQPTVVMGPFDYEFWALMTAPPLDE